MASASLSKYFNAISGDVDGLHFASTQYGTVLRSDPVRKPRVTTPAQAAQEERIRRTARGYANLTPSQVLAWGRLAATLTHYTKKGKPFTPNAYQAYSSLASVWYAIPGNSGTAPAEPPTGSYSGNGIQIEAQASANSVTFHGSGSTTTGTVLECSLQPLKNRNRRPSASGYRIVGYATLSVEDGNEFTVTVPPGVYAARYRFLEKASGRRTAFVDIVVTGVALSVAEGGVEETPAKARKKAA